MGEDRIPFEQAHDGDLSFQPGQVRPQAEMATAAERLVVAPDCGMKYLSRESAFGKLRAMVQAAEELRSRVAGVLHHVFERAGRGAAIAVAAAATGPEEPPGDRFLVEGDPQLLERAGPGPGGGAVGSPPDGGAVGGGIVAQSDPHAEYEETWHKAEGLLRALT